MWFQSTANNSGCWDLRLPHTLCHTLGPWHFGALGGLLSEFHQERALPVCLANQGTAKGDDWKSSFKNSVKPKHQCCWMLGLPPQFLLLNCSWRKLEFACESRPVCSLGRIKQSCFRQQHTKWLKLLSKWTYNYAGSYNLILLLQQSYTGRNVWTRKDWEILLHLPTAEMTSTEVCVPM